jgi:hypothetical protein
MGIRPDGEVAHNGLDHWWDDQGVGNCWEDNVYSRGEQTDNFLVDPGPCADGGSVFLPGAPVKDADFLSCSQYDRNDPTLRHPPGCSWFDSPTRPEAEPAPAAAPAPREGDDDTLVAAPVVTLAGLLLLLGLGRRGRGSRAA